MASSTRRTDILSLIHLRSDGRRPHEIRHMTCHLGALPSTTACGSALPTSACSGSALVSMGLTQVLCIVKGPCDVGRRSDELSDRAVLDVSMQTTPFAPPGDRRNVNPTTDRRLIEQSHLLQKALSASILLHLYPKCKISVTVMVLADDGGRLEAAINAATLALIDAGIPLKDMVCACSAGRWNAGGSDTIVVDLNRREIQTATGLDGGGGGCSDTIYLPVATMPQRGTIVLSQCESRLSGGAEAFAQVLDAAMVGCQMVMDVMAAAVRERGAGLWLAKEGKAQVLLNVW
jgi:exosome complex component RRP41